MRDKFSLNYKQGPRPDPKAQAGGSRISIRGNPAKRQLLHDHRSSDSLIEYLDDLEE